MPPPHEGRVLYRCPLSPPRILLRIHSISGIFSIVSCMGATMGQKLGVRIGRSKPESRVRSVRDLRAKPESRAKPENEQGRVQEN